MSAKLVITVGLPGSGKSAWAREQVASVTDASIVRVNRDDLRMMLFNTDFFRPPAFPDRNAYEGVLTALQQAAVRKGLQEGLTVIVDDTNVHILSRKTWETLAQEEGAEFEIKFMELDDVDECVKRDLERHRRTGASLVGREVIERMALTLQKFK